MGLAPHGSTIATGALRFQRSRSQGGWAACCRSRRPATSRCCTDYIRPDQRFVTCPNQDVVYGFGFAAVDKEPIIIQVPDFGKRFWVIALYDARTDGFGGLGQQYATKPGNYMVVGPHWRGKEPKGVTKVFRAPTKLIGMAPRIFMDNSAEDRKAIQPLLNQMIIYPLGQYNGEQKTKDWSKVPSFPSPSSSGDEETHWVDPATFFDELPEVLREVPPLPGEEALYARIRSLLDAAAKSPAVKEQLNRIAIDAEKSLIGPLFDSAIRPSRWAAVGRRRRTERASGTIT